MQTGPDRTVTKVLCSQIADWSKPIVNRITMDGEGYTTDDEGLTHP